MHLGWDETSTTYISGSGEPLPILIRVSPREPRPRSGVIFFHGGGWIGGGPEQFPPRVPHACSRRHPLGDGPLSTLGHGASTLADCVADARGAAIERIRGSGV